MDDNRPKVSMTVTTTRTLLLPTLPNYLRTTTDETLDVGDLTEQQVREIGAQWTDALIRKSRNRKGYGIAKLNRELAKHGA